METREGYKKTEIGWIPEEWAVKSLISLATITMGQSPGSQAYNEDFDGLPLIQGNADIKNRISNPRIWTSQITKICNINDILMTVRAPVGAIAKSMHEACIGRGVCAIKAVNTENSFLYQVLLSHEPNWRKIEQGSTFTAVNGKDIQALPIICPPLPEQQKIASILTTVDDKISSIDQQIQQTEQLKKGLMEKLLTKGIGHTEFKDTEIGRIPASWEYKSFQDLLENKDITSIQDGNHGESHPKTSDFVNDGIPFIMANCFLRNKLNIDCVSKISEKQYKSLRIGFSFPGDVLLTHKGTVGSTAIVYPEHGNIMLTPQVTAYRVSEGKNLLKRYLYFYFQSPYFQKIIFNISKQSTRAYIGITAQKRLLCVLPPIAEQKKIASILSTVDDKIDILQSKKTSYTTLKKGLMAQLLTGQMRVKI